MNLQESIRRILKGVAKKLSNKLHCDRHGSCVHFAELFVEEINNTHPELLKEFEVIEGYVDVKFGEGKPQEHTWIRLSDDEVIDPTFMQFTKYDKNAKYSRKRTKSYTGQEYYDIGVRGSWFSKRREEQPDTVFKGGLKESIRRILREEDFIPLEDLNTVIKDYEGGFDVFIMNGDKKIGEISFEEEDKPNQYTITDATIDDEYKGNRIYPKTIISLFKEKPNIIINSVFRSPEAQKAWIYLLSNLPPNIGKSVKYYKDEDTTLFQLKSRNLQESIRRILREESNKDILIDGLYDPIYEENGIVLFKEPKHLNVYSKFGIKKSNVISGKEFNKKYVDFSNKKLHKVLYKDGITLGGNLGEGKYWCSTEYCLSVYLGETHQSKEYSKYVKEVVDFKLGDNLKILVKKYISDDLWETYYNMNLQESIRRILREELAPSIRRRLNFHDIKRIIDNTKIENFLKNQDIEKSVHNTIRSVTYDFMPKELEDHEDEYHKVWDEIKKYLIKNYTEELTQYFEKRQRDVDNEKNPLGIEYIFIKHDKPYYENSGWSGFATGFNSFDDMITKYGNWVEVDWDEIKKKLDNINDYPVQTHTNTMNSRPLRISSIGDRGNDWGYNFSIIKQIPKENLDKVKDIQTERLHDTSWENDMGEKYYISWDENYGKSFKLVKTPYGAQSGGKWEPNLVSIVTPENTNAWYEWEELSDEKLDMWKENWDNIQKTLGNHKYNQIIRNM